LSSVYLIRRSKIDTPLTPMLYSFVRAGLYYFSCKTTSYTYLNEVSSILFDLSIAMFLGILPNHNRGEPREVSGRYIHADFINNVEGRPPEADAPKIPPVPLSERGKMALSLVTLRGTRPLRCLRLSCPGLLRLPVGAAALLRRNLRLPADRQPHPLSAWRQTAPESCV